MASLTNARRCAELVRWAEEVGTLVGRRPGTEAAIEAISQAVKQYTQVQFQITVLGKAKRGKSTLLNAMLGRHDDLVAPIDRLPASSAITRFRWAEEESTTVTFRDGRQDQIPYGQIRDFVTEELNPGNAKGVDVLDVYGPFPGLSRDVVLVDTPGAGSIHEHHDAILNAFIPQSDAVIFLVTARMPLDQDELELLQEVKSADIRRVFFAVNRADEVNEPDLADAISHNRGLLAKVGIHVDRLHVLSAKKAYLGQVAESGLVPLMDEVAKCVAEGKGKVVGERLVARVCIAGASVCQAMAVELEAARKSTAELDAEIGRLEAVRAAMPDRRGAAESAFLEGWGKAVSDFDQAVTRARQVVAQRVVNDVTACTLLGIASMAKRLPTMITRLADEALSAPGRKLMESLDALRPRLATTPRVSEMEEHACLGSSCVPVPFP